MVLRRFKKDIEGEGLLAHRPATAPVNNGLEALHRAKVQSGGGSENNREEGNPQGSEMLSKRSTFVAKTMPSRSLLSRSPILITEVPERGQQSTPDLALQHPFVKQRGSSKARRPRTAPSPSRAVELSQIVPNNQVLVHAVSMPAGNRLQAISRPRARTALARVPLEYRLEELRTNEVLKKRFLKEVEEEQVTVVKKPRPKTSRYRSKRELNELLQACLATNDPVVRADAILHIRGGGIFSNQVASMLMDPQTKLALKERERVIKMIRQRRMNDILIKTRAKQEARRRLLQIEIDGGRVRRLRLQVEDKQRRRQWLANLVQAAVTKKLCAALLKFKFENEQKRAMRLIVRRCRKFVSTRRTMRLAKALIQIQLGFHRHVQRWRKARFESAAKKIECFLFDVEKVHSDSGWSVDKCPFNVVIHRMWSRFKSAKRLQLFFRKKLHEVMSQRELICKQWESRESMLIEEEVYRRTDQWEASRHTAAVALACLPGAQNNLNNVLNMTNGLLKGKKGARKAQIEERSAIIKQERENVRCDPLLCIPLELKVQVCREMVRLVRIKRRAERLRHQELLAQLRKEGKGSGRIAASLQAVTSVSQSLFLPEPELHALMEAGKVYSKQMQYLLEPTTPSRLGDGVTKTRTALPTVAAITEEALKGVDKYDNHKGGLSSPRGGLPSVALQTYSVSNASPSIFSGRTDLDVL